MLRALEEFGLYGKKLACFDRTDSEDIAGQLCQVIGVVYESPFGHMVEEWIMEAKEEEPVLKRLRGEHTMDPLHSGISRGPLHRWRLL